MLMAQLASTARTFLQEASAPLESSLGLTKLPEFAHIITASIVFFTTIHLVLSPFLSTLFFPKAYGQLNKKAKNSWDIHVVSFVHSIIIVYLAAPKLFNPELDKDRAFGWDNSVGIVGSIASGYFIWDTLDAVINFVDLGFVLHGIACTLIYTLAFRPFLAYYCNHCLLWEVSTIFLNIHWFLDKTGRTGSPLQLVNGIFLLGAFLGVRIIYGGKISIEFFQTLYGARDQIPFAYVLVYGVGNVLLNCLNWFWFFKMVSALRKRFSSPSPSHNGKAVNGNAQNGVANGKHD